MNFLPDPLHPAIVHFPIALAMVALLFEVISRHRRLAGLAPAGSLLVVLAALGALAAYVTGRLAADEAVVPPDAAGILDTHEDLGIAVMVGLVMLALVRLALARGGRSSGVAAWLYIGAFAVVVALVVRTGHLGGQMVFRHGVGTAPVERLLSQQPSPTTPSGG